MFVVLRFHLKRMREAKWEPDCFLWALWGLSCWRTISWLLWSMTSKCLSATWPPFLSASLCHRSTYSGPLLWQLSFHQTWPFQIDEDRIIVTALWAIFRLNDCSCYIEAFGSIRKTWGLFLLLTHLIKLKGLSDEIYHPGLKTLNPVNWTTTSRMWDHLERCLETTMLSTFHLLCRFLLLQIALLSVRVALVLTLWVRLGSCPLLKAHSACCPMFVSLKGSIKPTWWPEVKRLNVCLTNVSSSNDSSYREAFWMHN